MVAPLHPALPPGARYVIQGFGNVGAWAADILSEMGGRVGMRGGGDSRHPE